MQIAGLNNQTVRQHNRRAIMTLIWRYKRLSKSQLATHTGLSIPAISKILDELVGEGKLSHYSENLSSRGMNSGHYQIPKEGPLILCMNVTPTSIENQLIDAQMTPVGEFLQTQINAPTPEHLLSAIEALWREQQKNARDGESILRLGFMVRWILIRVSRKQCRRHRGKNQLRLSTCWKNVWEYRFASITTASC